MENKNFGVTVYSNPDAIETRDVFNKMMANEKILTTTRLGGIDFEIARMYYANPNCFDDDTKIASCIDGVMRTKYEEELFQARNFPGYFDFDDKKENFMLYAKKLVTYFGDFDFATYAGITLIDKIQKECYTEEDVKFLSYILSNKTIVNYSFLECPYIFLNSFKTWGEGKRILVVSPLSKSVQFQYQRREHIVKDYTFPNFELLTLNTNLTWQHPGDTKEKLGLKTNNWHEECDRLNEEISKLDFDIAFLSCGSYAMHLGYFIKNEMKKKSLYVGGSLNLHFSIFGARWWVYYTSPYINPKYILDPFENEDVKKITAGREWKSESVNAYFGHRADVLTKNEK